MMNKSALFLVQSPLHVHNAHEAIVKFGIDSSTFLVVTNKGNSKWAEMMILTLPSDAHCLFAERNDYDIEGTTKSYTQYIPELRNKPFDYVFFSDSRLYIFVDIVKALQHPNTYLMDDGAGIIQSVNTMVQSGQYFEFAESTIPERRKLIEDVKSKYNVWQLPSLRYDLFTAFDYVSCDMYDVIENPMHRFSHSHEEVDSDRVLILGQPITKNGHMTQQLYFESILQMKSRYCGKQFLYFPHPREKQTYLLELCERASMELVLSKLSAEEYLMKTSNTPGIVSSFYSAALWYIAKFQSGLQVDAHRLTPNSLCTPHQRKMPSSKNLSVMNAIELAYEHYGKRMNVHKPLSSEESIEI